MSLQSRLFILICLGVLAIALNSPKYDVLKNAPPILFDSTKHTNNPEKLLLDSSIQLTNGSAFIKAGYTGKSIKVGIIDIGFKGADQDSSLLHVFDGFRVKAFQDYIDPDKDKNYESNNDMDSHGTFVWKYIAGKDLSKKKQYGLATNAEFYLARTDDGSKEYRDEQLFFKQALDWFDSLGVRLVHTSLGYSYGFDDPSENYVPEDIDGKTSLITMVVQEAAKKDGMIIVTSAGNEGDGIWRILSAPADAENILSVGSTDALNGKRDFSSEGPDFLPYLKPDISCFNALGGTSFSAPVITGIIACMLEKKPSLTNDQIINLIEKSSHLYPYGNNYVGYGVPNGERILTLMDSADFDLKQTHLVEANKPGIVLDFETSVSTVTIYHKMNKWVVLKQDRQPVNRNNFVLNHPGNIKRSKLVIENKLKFEFHMEENEQPVTHTTVVTPSKIYEVVWK